MKIEKVNDHQIRCTLTKNDLADRELKISELAYGTEKAKNLFRDMMQQASFECGFEAEDIPLMIEAIPLNSECIVLIITKVEDSSLYSDGADDVLDLFKKIHDSRFKDALDAEMEKAASETSSLSSFMNEDSEEISAPTENTELVKIFSFSHLNEVTRLAHVLKNYYDGVNSLYKNETAGRYLLLLSKSGHTPEEFNKVCNIISEYGVSEKHASASGAYLNEHCDIIISDHALQSLLRI